MLATELAARLCCGESQEAARPRSWRYTAEHAAELRITQSAEVQAEIELGFAALHGLLIPVPVTPGPPSRTAGISAIREVSGAPLWLP